MFIFAACWGVENTDTYKRILKLNIEMIYTEVQDLQQSDI